MEFNYPFQSLTFTKTGDGVYKSSGHPSAGHGLPDRANPLRLIPPFGLDSDDQAVR